MQEIIIIGAGGHAKVCIELLQAMGESIAYCIGTEDSPDRCLGFSVLKGDKHLVGLYQQGYRRAFIAVGSNKLREELAAKVLSNGYEMVNAISPHAVISSTARLGIGIAIMAGVVINADTIIKDFTIINTGATVDHDCYVGKLVHIAPQSSLAGNVIVGDYSFLGSGCCIIPGVNIGKNVTIGAGGVVISDIADENIVVGVPAKMIKHKGNIK